MAIIYSCENSENNGNSKTESSKSKQESQTDIGNAKTQEPNIDTERIKELLQTAPKKDIHIVKYKGTLGESNITLELKNLSDEENSLYMYDNINNPLVLEYDKTKNYICLNELFPKKDKKEYKKGGTLSFKNNKDLVFELTGEYKNPKGTKTYPVHLQAIEVYTKDQEEDFEELQEYRTDKHYFTLISSWFEDDYFNETLREVKQINVYDKKTNKMLQSLDVPFGKNNCSAVVEPTNTKPNGIQIGCSPNGVLNPSGFDDYIAFFINNGKYEKDKLVSGHNEYGYGTDYRKYNKNGDVFEVSKDSESEYFEKTTYITSSSKIKTETLKQNLQENRCEKEIIYEDYVEKVLIMPDCDNPKYIQTTKEDKKGNVLSCKVETNYNGNDYKLSADGKTLLECSASLIHFDLNGQEDLRKVEKIDKNAFLEDDLDEEIIEDYLMDLPFSITLNSNFKEIPKEIKKYDYLKEITKLAPNCLENN